MEEVGVYEAKPHLAVLLARVELGERILDHGVTEPVRRTRSDRSPRSAEYPRRLERFACGA
jgi:antitoxin (DNA-binding transcriptional repressor) of toxin-antitoxin stability system